jgi:hypothetical protein
MGFWANRRCIKALERENKELRERAEHAERMWKIQYKNAADAAYELQRERHNSSQIEARCMKKLMRLAQFAAVRMIEKLGFAVTVQLHKTGGDFCLEQLTVVLRSHFVINAFCTILGITKEELLSDSNLRWEEKLKQALSDNHVLRKNDDFSDIGGRLSLKDCCQMNKCGTADCQEKQSNQTK